jgi:hypothetical protein
MSVEVISPAIHVAIDTLLLAGFWLDLSARMCIRFARVNMQEKAKEG